MQFIFIFYSLTHQNSTLASEISVVMNCKNGGRSRFDWQEFLTSNNDDFS